MCVYMREREPLFRSNYVKYNVKFSRSLFKLMCQAFDADARAIAPVNDRPPRQNDQLADIYVSVEVHTFSVD